MFAKKAGDLVILRSYGGMPLVRRVWSWDSVAVYITNDEQFERLIDGKSAIQPVGFPLEDVFAYDEGVAASIDSLFESGRMDWKKLRPWTGIEP
jgi:hypothetical protein